MLKDNLSKALYVYVHFGSKAGDVLNSDYFLGVGRLRTWSASDLQDGVYEAERKGLVEKATGGWRLTEAGFQEIASVPTS